MKLHGITPEASIILETEDPTSILHLPGELGEFCYFFVAAN